MAKKANSRQVAAEIVSEWLTDQRFPDRRLAQLKQDHAFIMELVNGVVRNQNILKWIVAKWVQKEPQPFFKAVLYVGLYQLLFMDRVEEYAAISETVEAAKRRPGGPGAAKMINAVLRRAQREKADVLAELKQQPDFIRLSHPKFLMNRWIRNFGEVDARKLAEWNNQPSETILRVEQMKISLADFMDELAKAEIAVRQHPSRDRETFLILPRGVSVKSVPGYEEGWFTVQDPATAASVDLLGPLPGERVLDACAAPGGKMAMIAGRMQGRGELVAMDLHADRIDVLKENCTRLNLDWVEVLQGDARKPKSALQDRLFDAILLDVPCLNTGVLRRRVDARWRVDEERIKSIALTQYAILSACADLLAPGGRIVYSTCSLEAEENESLVARWVREHPEFRMRKSRREFPPKSGTDGAYAALIQKD